MSRSQRGGAVIETFLLGLLLLVPLVWALGVLADLHRGALAATAAAREAGLDAARASEPSEADAAVEAAVETAFLNQGLDPRDARVEWTSDPQLARGGTVEVEVSYPVSVVQAPLLGRTTGPSVWVRARHSARIDLWRSR